MYLIERHASNFGLSNRLEWKNAWICFDPPWLPVEMRAFDLLTVRMDRDGHMSQMKKVLAMDEKVPPGKITVGGTFVIGNIARK